MMGLGVVRETEGEVVKKTPVMEAFFKEGHEGFWSWELPCQMASQKSSQFRRNVVLCVPEGCSGKHTLERGLW